MCAGNPTCRRNICLSATKPNFFGQYCGKDKEWSHSKAAALCHGPRTLLRGAQRLAGSALRAVFSPVASFISPDAHIWTMDGGIEHLQLNVPRLDLDRLAARLDRMDILLLREFYVTGRPYPDDTTSYVLRLLVDEFQRRHRRGRGQASYHTIRRRLENLRALGLVGKIPQTNPVVYFGLESLAAEIRRLIVRFAADLVGTRLRRQVSL